MYSREGNNSGSRVPSSIWHWVCTVQPFPWLKPTMSYVSWYLLAEDPCRRRHKSSHAPPRSKTCTSQHMKGHSTSPAASIQITTITKNNQSVTLLQTNYHQGSTKVKILARPSGNLHFSFPCLKLLQTSPKFSQAASPEISHHTVWRTWLFMVHWHDNRLYYKLSPPHLYISLWKVERIFFLTWEWKG